MRLCDRDDARLTSGEAPLRGRAGLELLMTADDYRGAATRLPTPTDLATALRVFAVIGGIVGYATDMVDFDLPASLEDFDRWVIQRVLSPRQRYGARPRRCSTKIQPSAARVPYCTTRPSAQSRTDP